MDWKEKKGNGGEKYYENSITGETVMEKPEMNLEATLGDVENHKIQNNSLETIVPIADSDDSKLYDDGEYDNSREELIEQLIEGWREETDTEGSICYVNDSTGQRRVSKPVRMVKASSIEKEPVEEILSAKQIHMQISDCLLDLVRDVVEIHKFVRQEMKRKKKKKIQLDENRYFQIAFQSIPGSLPQVDPDIRRRQRLRLDNQQKPRIKRSGSELSQDYERKKEEIVRMNTITSMIS